MLCDKCKVDLIFISFFIIRFFFLKCVLCSKVYTVNQLTTKQILKTHSYHFLYRLFGMSFMYHQKMFKGKQCLAHLQKFSVSLGVSFHQSSYLAVVMFWNTLLHCHSAGHGPLFSQQCSWGTWNRFKTEEIHNSDVIKQHLTSGRLTNKTMLKSSNLY